MHRDYGVSLVGPVKRYSQKDYGVSLGGLLRDIGRQIEVSYAQGLWVSLVELLRDIARKIEFYAQGKWGKFSGAIERYSQKDLGLCSGKMG